MKKLIELKTGDIIYAINKENINSIFELVVTDISEYHLYINTIFGIKKCYLNPDLYINPKGNLYSTTFTFEHNKTKYKYYISTDKNELINSYNKWLIDSEKYYNNNIQELNKELIKNTNLLAKVKQDIKLLSKL